jgi:hypothetical protein
MRNFTPPPQTLRKAKLDNLALVPGSLLPFKKEWQQLADSLPEGSTLIVLPAAKGAARTTLLKVSQSLKSNGRRVITLALDQISNGL